MSSTRASAALLAIAPRDARACVTGQCAFALLNERNNNLNNNASPSQAGD